MQDVFKLPLAERHAQFTPMLESSPDLAEALQKVTTIAQMVLLLPRQSLALPAATSNASAAAADGAAGAAAAAAVDGGGGESSSSSSSSVAAGAPAPLLMINTHLFFHPYAPHIRSLHTAAILEEAAAALAEWQQQAQLLSSQQQDLAAAAVFEPHGSSSGSSSSTAVEPGVLQALAQLPPPTVLFCGDLNSDLNSGVPGVVEMLQTGRLAADHWDWQMGASFRWGWCKKCRGTGLHMHASKADTPLSLF
jgi:2',5'-phosphodiesterase